MVAAKLGGPWNRVVNGASRRGSFYHPIRPEINADSRTAPSLWSVRETRVETEKQEGSGLISAETFSVSTPPTPNLHVQPEVVADEGKGGSRTTRVRGLVNVRVTVGRI